MSEEEYDPANTFLSEEEWIIKNGTDKQLTDYILSLGSGNTSRYASESPGDKNEKLYTRSRE